MSTNTLALLIPEMLLIGTAVLIYLGGAFAPTPRVWGWLGVLGAVAALVLLSMGGPPAGNVPGPLAADGLAWLVRWFVFLLAVAFALSAATADMREHHAEYAGTLLVAMAGLAITAAARELVLLFVGLELVSIPTYVLLYLGRRDQPAQEAAVKYFYLSLLASALLLYGFSFLYGIAGTTNLSGLFARLQPHLGQTDGTWLLARLGFVLVLAGLGFRLAAVPFHFYAPDVYHGTSSSNAGLLAVLPKAAGIVVLVRVLGLAMPGIGEFAWRVVLPVAALTMTVGNLLALRQDHVRRLLAYSSIAHAGYMLVGISAAMVAAPVNPAAMDGLAAAVIYLLMYAVAAAGLFATLAWLGGEGCEIEGVEQLAGLGRTHPTAAAALAVFLFSLAGLPPLAGFWGKFSVFASALAAVAEGWPQRWLVALAVLGVVNAAVAAAYYLRLIGIMYFRLPLAPPLARGGRGARWAMTLSAVLVIALGAFPGWLTASAAAALRDARAQLQSASVSLGSLPAPQPAAR
jgi:NADH-quinone oxidoreductase subunit N